MKIWKVDATPEQLNSSARGTLSDHMGILFTQVGEDFLEATMPVRATNKQPHGLLHGGASCVLAETIGSVAANLVLDNSKEVAVGQSIEANHLRPATDGEVRAIVKAIHLGKSSHVWEIRIYNSDHKLICHSKLTTRVVLKQE